MVPPAILPHPRDGLGSVFDNGEVKWWWGEECALRGVGARVVVGRVGAGIYGAVWREDGSVDIVNTAGGKGGRVGDESGQYEGRGRERNGRAVVPWGVEPAQSASPLFLLSVPLVRCAFGGGGGLTR